MYGILLGSSEPNVFGNYEAFGFSEAARKCEKRWVTLHASNLVRRQASGAQCKIGRYLAKSAQPNLQEAIHLPPLRG